MLAGAMTRAVLYAIPGLASLRRGVEAALRLEGRRRTGASTCSRSLSRPCPAPRFGRADGAGRRVPRRRRVSGSRRDHARARRARARAAADAARGRPRAAPAVERAETWGDEVLQPLARRLIWAALRRAPGAMLSYAAGARPAACRAPLARLGAPLVARAEQRRPPRATTPTCAPTSIHLDAPPAARRGLDRGGHARRRRRRTPPTCRSPPRSGCCSPSRTSRPRSTAARAGALARRWFPDFPGRVPAGALPADWLPRAA